MSLTITFLFFYLPSTTISTHFEKAIQPVPAVIIELQHKVSLRVFSAAHFSCYETCYAPMAFEKEEEASVGESKTEKIN